MGQRARLSLSEGWLREEAGPAGAINPVLILGWEGLEQTAPSVKDEHSDLFNETDGVYIPKVRGRNKVSRLAARVSYRDPEAFVFRLTTVRLEKGKHPE